MKKLLMVTALAAIFAGCATSDKVKVASDGVTPVVEDKDINPYAQYEACWLEDPNEPMAVVWQGKNGDAIAKATAIEELKTQIMLPKTADDLLAQVKSAYETDPLVATKIAAVSQLVMCTKWDKAPAARQLWTSALLGAAEQAPDEYRKLFFLDQLRWCGKANQKDRILAIGRKSGSKAVEDFAVMVATEVAASKEVK